MPNIAAVFKAEITRIARRELREESASIKRAMTTHRAEIASLKKRVRDLEAQLKQVRAKTAPSIARDAGGAPAGAEGQKTRFSVKGIKSMRKRLGLSAHDFGLLVGASGQSVYNWESGGPRPQPQRLAAIAKLKSIGKREARARLDLLPPV